MLHKHNVHSGQENSAQIVTASKTNSLQDMLSKTHPYKLRYRAGEPVQISISQGQRPGIHLQVWYNQEIPSRKEERLQAMGRHRVSELMN